MAFKGKGVVLAGLAVGAASVLSKKDNRNKLMGYINQAKEMLNTTGGMQSIKDMLENNMKAKTLKLKPDKGGPSSSGGDFINELDDGHVKRDKANLTTNMEERIEQEASLTETSRSSELEANHMTEEGSTQTLINAYNNLQADEAESNK